MNANGRCVHNTVQSYGCLVAADMHSGIISHASANCTDFFGVDAQNLLNHTLADTLGDVLAHDINNVLCRSSSRIQRAAAGFMSAGPGSFDMTVHLRADVAIIELQPQRDAARDGAEGLERLRWLLTRVDAFMSVEKFVQEATNLLRALSGYHRVLAYHFNPEGGCERVAQSGESLTEPSPDTSYPDFGCTPSIATEWPDGAVRHIADTGADDVQLLALDPEKDPLNMSLALLRGVQPELRAQLHTAGVLSSLSLPIMMNGRRWGAFTAHHHRACLLSRDQLMAIEASGKLLSLLIGHRLGR